MARLGIVAVVFASALLTFGAMSCQEEGTAREPTAIPTATPGWREANGECKDLATQATQVKFGVDSSQEVTEDFFAFEMRVEELGDPYGVPSLFLGDWFKEYYESLFGRSPMKHPEAWRFYESQRENCMREKGLKPEDDPLAFLADWPSAEERPIIECVTTLIIETEREYGEGSIGYTNAYRNFAENRPVCGEEGVDLLGHEKLYQEITGRSPFVNAEAMASFRAKAKDCPE